MKWYIIQLNIIKLSLQKRNSSDRGKGTIHFETHPLYLMRNIIQARGSFIYVQFET
jgi:hypothetical protein